MARRRRPRLQSDYQHSIKPAIHEIYNCSKLNDLPTRPQFRTRTVTNLFLGEKLTFKTYKNS